MTHPFATRRGREFRNRFVMDFYISGKAHCEMCGAWLRPGKKHDNATVVDHVRPYKLRPDLTFEPDNLRVICRSCHSVCEGIEARHSGDADAIAKAKQAWRVQQFDADGRLIW